MLDDTNLNISIAIVANLYGPITFGGKFLFTVDITLI